MNSSNRKNHWENIYQTKKLSDVSWYQPIPETSLTFFKQFEVPKQAKIIDVGGGDSFLVEHLLDLGYQNISVLDISETAIERVKQRLGDLAEKVTWINEDVSVLKPTQKYDLWHDRAAFHFLTNQNDISNYIESAYESLNPHGILILGTFSESGPKKCSGIEIKQYSREELVETFDAFFENIDGINVDHSTPFDTIQNFTFCSFRKR